MVLDIKIKRAIWYILVFFLSLVFWRYIDYILNVITPVSWTFDVEPTKVIGLFLLLSMISLGVLLFPQKRWALGIAMAIGLGYLLTFGFHWLQLVAFGIMVFMVIDSLRSVREDLNERLRLNIRSILRKGMPQLFIGISLMASFAAYNSPVIESYAKDTRVPPGMARLIENVTDNIVRDQAPGASDAEREMIATEVARQTENQLNALLGRYAEYVPPALAFTLFLALWSVSWIFIWVPVLLGIVLFQILKLIKFVKIEEYDAKAEKLIV